MDILADPLEMGFWIIGNSSINQCREQGPRSNDYSQLGSRARSREASGRQIVKQMTIGRPLYRRSVEHQLVIKM